MMVSSNRVFNWSPDVSLVMLTLSPKLDLKRLYVILMSPGLMGMNQIWRLSILRIWLK